MAKRHPKNVRIKHGYIAWLREARGAQPDTIDAAAAAIDQFERANNGKDFAAFRVEQAERFKRVLAESVNPRTRRPLAVATIHARLLALKAFFMWLADQPGYKSRIGYTDCDYFNPSANDARIAKARRERPVPEIGQIRRVLDNMPYGTATEKRDRALIAFTLLSGARDDAIASLKIGHVDLEARTVFQDARTVRTKNRKTFTSSFFPVGEECEAIVADWIGYQRGDLLFGADAPLFPATRVGFATDGGFAADGLELRHWTSAAPIRRIFRESFEAAGIRYYNPHSFRHTLARLGQTICKTPEALKAWSQNLAHEDVLTTFASYGEVPGYRQAEIMEGLRRRSGLPAGTEDAPDAETVDRVLEYLKGKVSKG